MTGVSEGVQLEEDIPSASASLQEENVGLAVPQTTTALLLTDGIIPSIEKPNLANLSSLTLLKLSNNGIVDINEDCFHGLSGLRALLLDQNQITSDTIMELTFTGTPNLERLQLGNNGISQINRSWFSNLTQLGFLNLGRNHITKLEADTFTRSNLRNLQVLDLSNNSIYYIDKHAFRGLGGLRWLDLSRNRLTGMADSFSHLPKLSVLNLNLNHWNCTCQLQELTVFLRNFVTCPDRTLINAKELVCERTESLAVQKVLQLTDANCTSQSQNGTVTAESGNYRRYLRDVVLVALFCFAGSTEGFRIGNCSGNSYYLPKDPTGLYNLGKEYWKWIPKTRTVRHGQPITQFKSQCRYFPNPLRSNAQSQFGRVALALDPCSEIRDHPLPEGSIRNIELLSGSDVSRNHNNHRQHLCHSNRVPTRMNKKVGSKVRGEDLIGSIKGNASATWQHDILVLTKQTNDTANQAPFGKEEPGSHMKDRASYRGSHFIDQVEISGTTWEGDRTRRPKTVMFDLPGFIDAKLTLSPGTGSKTRGEGREARASVEKGRRYQVEEKTLLRPLHSRKRSDESRKRLGLKLASVDSKSRRVIPHRASVDSKFRRVIPHRASVDSKSRRVIPHRASVDSKSRRVIPHRASVNVLMVKFILHPTKYEKIHPDEGESIKGPFRMKKQIMAKKTGLKETAKQGKSTRKPSACQSTIKTGSLQQSYSLKRLNQCPPVPIQNKAFCQPHPATRPDKRDGVKGCSGSLCTDLETTSRVLSPMSPTPVTDTDNHRSPLSIGFPLGIVPAGPQDSTPSMGPLQTPNKSSNHEATPLDITHKITPSLPSATETPCSNISRTPVDDHEDKEEPAELNSSTAFTFQLQEAALSSDSEGMTVPNAPSLRRAPGMKPTDRGELVNRATGWQGPNQAMQRDGDWQTAPSGQTGDNGGTTKEQCEDSGSLSFMGMVQSDRHVEVKGVVEDKPRGNSEQSTPAPASETEPATGQAFSEAAVTCGADGPRGETEDGAAKAADAIKQHWRPTETLPFLPASSIHTGLRNLDHINGENIASKRQNGNVDCVNSPLTSPRLGAGGSEEQGPSVVIFSSENPREGMVPVEPQTGACTLPPKPNMATLDGAGDEANQRRKIRLVIPERPSSRSDNSVSRKIR
ncbi:hypothetical protein scyTo_0019223 [Scyliorhinus torazame]|uniref:LRRCT domain-containing protein n=1 Tax=Scyliorhinus torazame TaxID=75743 RepID=A0A401PV24_SCYTO|nr:hypothetical protein [Scyliorhinus torazame]